MLYFTWNTSFNPAADLDFMESDLSTFDGQDFIVIRQL